MADPPVSHDFAYVHTDIPAGMTIGEWRGQRTAERGASRAARRSRRSPRHATHHDRPRLATRATAASTANGTWGPRVTRRALAGAVAVVIATVTVSVIEGAPHRLPGVALGSAILLHAERALALLAVTAAALSIPVQATRGRLPIELSTSGLRYEAEAADDAVAAAVDLQDQLHDLGRLVVELAERLDALAERP
jgi:hypothetical protein